MKGTLIVVLLLFSMLAQATPSGHWLGMLNIKKMTYRIYLKYSGSSGQVFILNPKSHEIPLDTLFFRNDSLYFKRSDFYSIFEGKYTTKSNTIGGYWTDDGHKKHPVIFRPVDPDTLVGLRPKVLKTYQWKAPEDRGDDLKIGTLVETNTDINMLDSLSYRVMREQYPNMHAILISRSGLLIYEEYFYGWKAENLWLIQSATKSFTSALTGIALAKNELKNIEDPICKYLDDYKQQACNSQNGDLTVRQLLSMTTGLEWNELEFDYGDERNSAYQCGKARDPFECALSRSKIRSTEPVFAYNSMNHLMMNKILRKSTSLKNEKELQQRLLTPLKIEKVDVGNEDFGVIGDISITPRDMLKFGMLYLNNGEWNGQQIIPSNWVKESTASKIKISSDEGYGYFWWTKTFTVNEKTIDSYYAWGYGGQYIFVVPSLHLVVAMTASNWIMDEKKYAFEMMDKFILPACHSK
ncbi:MAG TPA: serine hydrolase [Chryseolinea sp.]|nr:serine hydrolase [Chryseolinea sp.]